MKTVRRVLTTAFAAGCLLVSQSTTTHGDSLGPDVNHQLALARAATVQYHDPQAAVDAGYIDMGVNPGEGGDTEFVNFGLIDCTLDVTQPEALRYVASGNGLRLVGVEYSIPKACPDTPPEDFLPGAAEWETEPAAPAWTYTVYIWSGNSVKQH